MTENASTLANPKRVRNLTHEDFLADLGSEGDGSDGEQAA